MAEKRVNSIEIKAPNFVTMIVPIIGDSPYVPHRQDVGVVKKAQHIGAVTTKKQRDLDTEYEACFYRDSNDNYAIPGSAFHAAICAATLDLDKIFKTTIRRNIHVAEEFATLEYKDIRRREDIVRQSGKTRAPDLRVRPEFTEWETSITVRFDADVISQESMLNLIALAGAKIGVGDHRLEQGHDSGAFHIGETNV